MNVRSKLLLIILISVSPSVWGQNTPLYTAPDQDTEPSAGRLIPAGVNPLCPHTL